MLVLKIITTVLIAFLGLSVALVIRNYKGKDEATSLILVEITYALSLICMWGG